jgi:hypothetical protein
MAPEMIRVATRFTKERAFPRFFFGEYVYFEFNLLFLNKPDREMSQ